MIEWAVVPTAGKGTRMYPAAAVIPKVLLPVGTRSMLHWALQEVVDAEIPRIALVVGPDQQLIRTYVDACLEAADHGDDGDLGALGRGLRAREIRWIEQPQPLGVGEAFMRCRETTGEATFAVLLPDNWFDASPPAIGQVATTYRETGMCTLGLTEVTPAEAPLFGNVGGVELEAISESSFRILALQDKLPGTFAERAPVPVLRGCARYVLDPRFYDALAATGPPPLGEWDDVPAFQWLLARGGLGAHRIVGVHYDVGLPRGYLAAAAHLFAAVPAGGSQR